MARTLSQVDARLTAEIATRAAQDKLIRAEIAELANRIAPPDSPTFPVASGIPMPTVEPVGFRRVFSDDFLVPIPEGQFPAATGGRWGAYPWPWKNSGGTGQYDTANISVHDSMLDMRLYTDAQGIPHQCNPNPIPPGGQNQLYGRYSACMKADPVDGFKVAWLLWPQSETWPRDGEIDFPEGSLDSTISAFMHRQGGTSGSDQDFYGTTSRFTTWHVYTIEWLPTRCTFLLDGVKIGEATSRIPNVPMRWQLQTETDLVPTKPPASAAGHVLVDWVTVAAKA